MLFQLSDVFNVGLRWVVVVVVKEGLGAKNCSGVPPVEIEVNLMLH